MIFVRLIFSNCINSQNIQGCEIKLHRITVKSPFQFSQFILLPTSDFLHCSEVLQFIRVHGWDLIVCVPRRDNDKRKCCWHHHSNWSGIPAWSRLYLHKGGIQADHASVTEKNVNDLLSPWLSAVRYSYLLMMCIFSRQHRKDKSPSKGGFNDGDVPIDFSAAPEGFDVGGVHCHCVGQTADPDSITDWKSKAVSVYLFSIQLSLSLCLSLSLSTFRTGTVTHFAALDSVLLHLVHSSTACSYTRPVCHHIVIYMKAETRQGFIHFYKHPR